MQETDVDMFNPGPHSPREFAHVPICCLVTKSCLTPFSTPWTVAHQAPLSTGFPSQAYWSGLPFLSPLLVYETTLILTIIVC